MKANKKLASLLSVATIATAMVVPTASAAVNGSLTFYHGVNESQKRTFGRIISTETENSMDITGSIQITAGEKTPGLYVINSNPEYNVPGLEVGAYVGKSKGWSRFNYYVDGTL